MSCAASTPLSRTVHPRYIFLLVVVTRKTCRQEDLMLARVLSPSVFALAIPKFFPEHRLIPIGGYTLLDDFLNHPCVNECPMHICDVKLE